MDNQAQNKKGRPQNKNNICICCKKQFQTTKRKCDHEAYIRKKGKSLATPSLAGEKLEERIKEIEFDQPIPFKKDIIPCDELGSLLCPITVQTISDGKPSSISKGSTAAESIKEMLHLTPEWKLAEQMFHTKEYELPYPLTKSFAQSFLLLGGNVQSVSQEFTNALCAVINSIGLQNIPKFLLLPYSTFFEKFEPCDHSPQTLKTLLKIAKEINAEVKWLQKVQRPLPIILEPYQLYHEKANAVAQTLVDQKDFYSLEYLNTISEVFQMAETSVFLFNTIDNFFDFIQKQKYIDRKVTLNNMLAYAGLDNTYGIELLTKQLKELENESKHSFTNDQLMLLLKLTNTKNFKAVKLMVRSLAKEAMVDDMAALLEDIEIQLKQQEEFVKQEEEKRQYAQEIENKMKAAEEEQKRITVEQEHQRFRQLEEYKQKKEEEQNQLEKQYQQQLSSCFNQYISMNSFLQCAFEDVLAFEKDLQKIATTIHKTLRPEQLITLGLLLLSQKHTTLIQLATGFGKSMLLGILAQHINKTTYKKVIVVVPTPFLHLYQESNYCPIASKIPEDINDSIVTDIFYCTYEQFLQLNSVVLYSAVVLIDEFHELFFNYPLTITDNGRLISVIQQLKAAQKVIGVSATFRGDAGIKKIKTILADSLYLTAPGDFQEKQLEFEVLGKLNSANINEKAIALAEEKSKEIPVVVFFTDIYTCQQWKTRFPAAEIFAGENAGELVALLEQFKKLSTGIILTTSAACKGADFVFAVPQAFVIHTVLPQTWLQLQQDSGRGVRGNPEIPVVGTIFTEKPYNNIEQVKKALSFSDRFDRLFTPDYLTAHSLLVACSASNATAPAVSFSKAVAMLNEGKSAAEMYKLLYSVKRFKEFLHKEVPKAEFQVPKPPAKKSTTEIINKNAIEEEKKVQKEENHEETLLGKRKESESCRKQTTKLGTMDIGSFFPSMRPATTSSAASIAIHKLHTVSDYADFGALQHEEGQGTVGLSSSALNTFAKQSGPSEIGPSDSVSQIGGESSASDNRRASKAITKFSKVLSEVSRSSLGRFEAKYKVGEKTASGAIVKEVNEIDWQFVERDKNGNSYFKCLKCIHAPRMRKGDRKRHACKKYDYS